MTRLPRLTSLLRTGTAGTVLAMSTLLTTAGAAHAVADGTPVADGQYRFSTKLTMTGIPRADGTTYDSACSGALVAPQWVITAGHCSLVSVESDGPACPHSQEETTSRVDQIADWIRQTTGTAAGGLPDVG